MFLLFSLYFGSLNLRYLKLTKMELTHFAMKLCVIALKEKSGPGVKRNLCRCEIYDVCEIYDPNPIPNPNLWP